MSFVRPRSALPLRVLHGAHHGRCRVVLAIIFSISHIFRLFEFTAHCTRIGTRVYTYSLPVPCVFNGRCIKRYVCTCIYTLIYYNTRRYVMLWKTYDIERTSSTIILTVEICYTDTARSCVYTYIAFYLSYIYMFIYTYIFISIIFFVTCSRLLCRKICSVLWRINIYTSCISEKN